MGKRIINKSSTSNEDIVKDLLSQTIENNGCREWIRCFNSDGYPRMGGNVKVHRLIYEKHTGESIHEKVIRHTCDNPKCINPEHLISGKPIDNIKDMDSRGRRYKVITRDIVFKTKALLATKAFLHTEIAQIVGIDERRVSDINRNLYNDNGQLQRH